MNAKNLNQNNFANKNMYVCTVYVQHLMALLNYHINYSINSFNLIRNL